MGQTGVWPVSKSLTEGLHRKDLHWRVQRTQVGEGRAVLQKPKPKLYRWLESWKFCFLYLLWDIGHSLLVHVGHFSLLSKGEGGAGGICVRSRRRELGRADSPQGGEGHLWWSWLQTTWGWHYGKEVMPCLKFQMSAEPFSCEPRTLKVAWCFETRPPFQVYSVLLFSSKIYQYDFMICGGFTVTLHA